MSSEERIDIDRLIAILRYSDDGFACDDAFDMADDLDPSYANQLPTLFRLLASSDSDESGMTRSFALKAILRIDSFAADTEALVRKLAVDSRDELLQLQALEALNHYGQRGTDTLASVIRRPRQTLMVRLVAAFYLLKIKLAS